jgi:HEAT repeat protein
VIDPAQRFNAPPNTPSLTPTDASASVRETAVIVLRKLGDASAKDSLTKLLRDESEAVRDAAKKALERLEQD